MRMRTRKQTRTSSSTRRSPWPGRHAHLALVAASSFLLSQLVARVQCVGVGIGERQFHQMYAPRSSNSLLVSEPELGENVIPRFSSHIRYLSDGGPLNKLQSEGHAAGDNDVDDEEVDKTEATDLSGYQPPMAPLSLENYMTEQDAEQQYAPVYIRYVSSGNGRSDDDDDVGAKKGSNPNYVSSGQSKLSESQFRHSLSSLLNTIKLNQPRFVKLMNGEEGDEERGEEGLPITSPWRVADYLSKANKYRYPSTPKSEPTRSYLPRSFPPLLTKFYGK